jgi:hypothetical protein
MAIPSQATSLRGIAPRNPVLAASGTFAYGLEFEKLVDLDALTVAARFSPPAWPASWRSRA